MTDLEIFAELDRVRNDHPVDFSPAQRQISALVEQLVARGALSTLVSRYADATNGALVRSVSLHLARAAQPELESDVSPLVFAMIERLHTIDAGARTNLLTAMQYLAMGEHLPAELPPQIYPFLLDCLDDSEVVQDGVAQVVGALFSRGTLDRWPREHVLELRARLLRRGSRGLDDFFLDTGRVPVPIDAHAPTDELLAALAADVLYDRAWAIMRAIAARPGGLAMLVERFADSQNRTLVRTLTLVATRAASDDPTFAPLVWRMMASLRIDDAETRLNLLDALDFVLRGGAPRAFAGARRRRSCRSCKPASRTAIRASASPPPTRSPRSMRTTTSSRCRQPTSRR